MLDALENALAQVLAFGVGDALHRAMQESPLSIGDVVSMCGLFRRHAPYRTELIAGTPTRSRSACVKPRS
jgi:hypothetical protein